MREQFERLALEFTNSLTTEWFVYWVLTVAILLISEVYFARYGRHSLHYYRRLLTPLHGMIAFGVAILIAMASSNGEDQNPHGFLFVLAILSFFMTVLALERLNVWIWSRFHRPRQQGKAGSSDKN